MAMKKKLRLAKKQHRIVPRLKKLKGLTLQFLPFTEIDLLDSAMRVKKLLQIILKNKIVILQGRLRPEEETRLIEDTMALVGTIKGFKGIELEVVSPSSQGMGMISTLKRGIAHALVGETDSLTVIGPAAIIKEMKKEPKKLEIMMSGK